MNTLARPLQLRPDTSPTPWLLLALLLTGFVLQRMGEFVVLLSFDATKPGMFWSALWSAAVSALPVLGFVPCLLYAPRWAWVPCVLFLAITLVLSVVFPSHENLALFVVSTVLPVLVYGAATGVAVRRRRQLDRGRPGKGSA